MFSTKKEITPATCAQFIRESRNIVALTGAGISTAAGIPDFRGPNGLYVTRQYDPDAVFDIDAFTRNPQPFYDFSRDFLKACHDIRPTLTHTFLAQLEAEGKLTALITQNIDPLHAQAGSKNITFLHGNYWSSHCRSCDAKISFDTLSALMDKESVPHCACGGVIKPDIVFFGEAVHGMPAAYQAVQGSDLLLVLGSSLAVHPAAMLPHEAGGKVVVVNRGEVAFPAGNETWFADTLLDDFFSEVKAILYQ